MGGLRKAFRLAACALLTIAVAACSSEEKQGTTLGQVAYGLVKAKLKKKDVEKAPKKAAAPTITRAQMAALGHPVLYVSIPRFGLAQPSVELAKNSPYRTYMGGNQSSVTLRSGIITSTRGLFVDLIAQETSIKPEHLFTGSFPKTFSKSQRHLGGDGTLKTVEYACAIAPHEASETITIFEIEHRVLQFTELCRNETRAFQNSYWVDQGTNTVWQSHQSVSQKVGHVVLQRVIK